ncbi:MAG: hypothetical protein AAGE65_03450 [Planctomycetota bacterium]
MATLTVTVDLPPEAEPDDTLRLTLVSEPQTAVADATPGQLLHTDRPVGDAVPGEPVTIEGTVDLQGSCGIHHWAVSLIDAAGNESPLHESFDLLADHPDGNTDHALSSGGQLQAALLTWNPPAS